MNKHPFKTWTSKPAIRWTFNILVGLVLVVAVGGGGWIYFQFSRSKDAPTLPESEGYAYDPSLDIQRTADGGIRFTVNASQATFRLDALPDDSHGGRLFPDVASALNYCATNGLRTIPSVPLLETKFKQFDDRLVRAVEHTADAGVAARGILPKNEALRRLLNLLLSQRPVSDPALVHIGAALQLNGEPQGSLPADIVERVQVAVDTFRSDEIRSRPIGAWADTDASRRLFETDRFLSAGISVEKSEAIAAVAQAVAADPLLVATFDFHHRLAAQLAGKPRSLSFQQVNGLSADQIRQRFRPHDVLALVPVVDSPETMLLERLWREGRLSGAENTMDLVIASVRDGSLVLTPGPDAGWYDRQWHAWEPLLLWDNTREAGKLKLTPAYRRRFERIFAAALTGGRETQIKRLPVLVLGMGGEQPHKVEIGPEFAAEPAFTVYLRRARAYRFIHEALEKLFGNEALPGALMDDLKRMTRFCYGLHDRLSREVGLVARYEDGELTVEERAAAEVELDRWMAAWQKDPALATDARLAVPILQTQPGGPIRYWANLGVKLQPVEYRFIRVPTVKGDVEPVFVSRTNYLATVVFGEFLRASARPLTRDEIRQMCDVHHDESSLRRSLGMESLVRHDRDWRVWLATVGWVALLAGVVVLMIRYPRYIRWVPVVLAIVLIAGAGRWWVSPSWRVRVIVKCVMPINTNVAMACENWFHEIVASEVAQVSELAELLEDSNPQVRYFAARLLGHACYLIEDNSPAWQQAQAREILIRAANDSDEAVDIAAADVLRRFPGDQTVKFLLDQVSKRKEPPGRYQAAIDTLGELHPPSALPVLLALAEDSNPEWSITAIRALKHYNSPAVTDVLRCAGCSPDRRVRRAVFGVLWGRSVDDAKSIVTNAVANPAMPVAEAVVHLESIHDHAVAEAGYRTLRGRAVTPDERAQANIGLALVLVGECPVSWWRSEQMLKRLRVADQLAVLEAMLAAGDKEEIRAWIQVNK